MRGLDIIGADRGALKSAVVGVQQRLQRTTAADAGLLVCAAIGAVIGAYLWRDHRVLGGLGGLAVGTAVSNLASDNPMTAVSNVACAGAGVVAALAWKRHPALGFAGASIGTGVVLSPLTQEKE